MLRYSLIPVYAAARLRVAGPLEAALRLGSYVGNRLWLDGHLLAVAASAQAFQLDDNCTAVQLTAGQHHLLIEIDREQWETVFHAQLSAPNGLNLPEGAVEVAEAVAESVGSRPPSDPPDPRRELPPAFDFYNDEINRPGERSLDLVSNGGWADLRAAFRREYRQLLGLPSPPPIVATVGNRFPWQGVWMERFVLRGGRGGPIPLYCLLPPSLNGAAPAVLAIQGHGPGKDDVVGRSTQDRAQTGGLAEDGNDYGLQLAQRG